MSAPSLGRLIDNIGALVLRQLTTWSLTTMLVIFLPRYLADDGLGKVTFAQQSMEALLVVTNLGTSTYLAKRISMRRGELSDVFWSGCLIRIVIGGLVVALLFALLNLTHVETEMRHLLYITSATLMVVSLQRGAEAAIQGLEKMRWLTFAEVANKLIVTIAGIAALLAGYRVVTFGAIVLEGACVALVIDMFALMRLGLCRPRFSRLFTKLLLRGGMPFLVAGAVAQLYAWVDIGSLQLLTGSQVVGWYGAAAQLCLTLNFLPFIMATALLPPMARAWSRNDNENFLTLARYGISLVLLTGLPIAVGLALVSSDLIALLGYPAGFDNSIPVLVIMASCLPLTGVLMVANTIVVAMDRQAGWVKIMACALLLNVVLNVVFISFFQSWNGNGGIGVAAASVIAESFQMTLSLRLLPKGLFGRELTPQIARALAATALMAGVVVGAQQAGLHLLLVAPLGAATYAIASLVFGALRPADLSRIAKVWAAERNGTSDVEYIERAPVGA